MSGFWKGVLTLYILAAILFGAVANRTMPAVNQKGLVFYGALWPVWPLSIAINRKIIDMPMWAFSFKPSLLRQPAERKASPLRPL
jgi:hypothetical protein